MSYRRKLWLLLLVLPAGCTTVPPLAPPDVDLGPKRTVSEPPPLRFTPLPPHTNPSGQRYSIPLDQYPTTETWVPLERWCDANGLGAPRRAMTEAGVVYSFTSTNGTFVMRIGSLVASWRGMELHLGFAPQMGNGHPFVHVLDIRKNLLPLVDYAPPPRAPRVIVIDPGHGGSDAGTKNVSTGHTEKEYTLDWALRLQSMLAANGCMAYVTRKKDVTMGHYERVAVADEHHAEVFVSLHFNSAFPDHEENGLETFCLTPRGMPSTLTRGYRDDTSANFPGNALDVENVRLAFRVHRALLKVNGRADRGVRRMRFPTVLQEAHCPAVLIEGGYMSNPREARRIADPAYRQKLAEAVAEALLQDSGHAMNFSGESPPIATNRPASVIQGTPGQRNQTEAP